MEAEDYSINSQRKKMGFPAIGADIDGVINAAANLRMILNKPLPKELYLLHDSEVLGLKIPAGTKFRWIEGHYYMTEGKGIEERTLDHFPFKDTWLYGRAKVRLATSELLDQLKQLQLPTWDGNLIGKSLRDALVGLGYAAKCKNGYNVITPEGVNLLCEMKVLVP